jgi:hypothetical protein
MKINEAEKRQVWLAFATASIAATAGDPDCSMKDLVEDTCEVADEMLDAYLERFVGEQEESDEEERPVRARRGRK